jgi:anaerobic selenocysteine-containing dehydrogenase
MEDSKPERFLGYFQEGNKDERFEMGRYRLHDLLSQLWHECPGGRGQITKVQGLKDHPLNKGRLCPKGAKAIELVYHPDRLKYPLKKVDGQWKRISWDTALTVIADKLQNLKNEFGPEILSIFSGSIGVENLEMMELAQRFKGAFGSQTSSPWKASATGCASGQGR